MRAADIQAQKPRQFCWEEQHELCQLYQLGCENQVLEGDRATEEMLRELPLNEVAGRYPVPEWTVSEVDNVITICRNLPGLDHTESPSLYVAPASSPSPHLLTFSLNTLIVY